MTKTFIPKEDQRLPDSFKVVVSFVTGESEEIEVASTFAPRNGIIEVWTKEDTCKYLVVENVTKLEFDKNFSKIVAIRKEQEAKALEEEEKKLNKKNEKKDKAK